MSLSYSDFRSILTQTGEPLKQKEVWEFFQIVDEDQDGMLHIEELMKVSRLFTLSHSSIGARLRRLPATINHRTLTVQLTSVAFVQVVYSPPDDDMSLTTLYDAATDDDARASSASQAQPGRVSKNMLGRLGRGIDLGKSFTAAAGSKPMRASAPGLPPASGKPGVSVSKLQGPFVSSAPGKCRQSLDALTAMKNVKVATKSLDIQRPSVNFAPASGKCPCARPVKFATHANNSPNNSVQPLDSEQARDCSATLDEPRFVVPMLVEDPSSLTSSDKELQHRLIPNNAHSAMSCSTSNPVRFGKPCARAMLKLGEHETNDGSTTCGNIDGEQCHRSSVSQANYLGNALESTCLRPASTSTPPEQSCSTSNCQDAAARHAYAVHGPVRGCLMVASDLAAVDTLPDTLVSHQNSPGLQGSPTGGATLPLTHLTPVHSRHRSKPHLQPLPAGSTCLPVPLDKRLGPFSLGKGAAETSCRQSSVMACAQSGTSQS
jgi:hypothetical protein